LSEIDCKRFFVSGRVQGVFFRAGTAQEATRNGLAGWARNLPDGRVEILACGPKAQVDVLAAWLAHGPPSARVASVEMQSESPEAFSHLAGFHTH